MAYLNVDEIESALSALAAAHPGVCEVFTLPHRSVEGRTIRALRLGAHAAAERPGLFLVAGLHAREWVPPEICVSLAADLLEARQAGTGLVYGNSTFTREQVASIFESLNLFILADANPDGRFHSQNRDALWRRNRRVNTGLPARCQGVDLNRNFDFLWDFENKFSPAATVQTASDPCSASQTYRGPSPLSEPEVRNVAATLDSFPSIKWLIDIHSYSELILHHWGDDETQTTDRTMNFANPAFDTRRGVAGDSGYREFLPSADFAFVQAISQRIGAGIAAVRGRQYTVESAFGLYATSGTSDDYTYSRHLNDPNLPKVYGFTIECGTEFQPPFAEAENIMRDVSSGLLVFCLEAPALTPGAT
jgi:murein tripeptide amidase MpaA